MFSDDYIIQNITMKTKQKIKMFIEKNLVDPDDTSELADNDDIFKMGFVNSLFAMKLITYIESEFSINIENDEMHLGNFSSIEAICNFISNK